MTDGDWQRTHFRAGQPAGTERSRGGLLPWAVLLLALTGGGIALGEWQGLTDLGPRRWLSSLRTAPEPDPATVGHPAAADSAAPVGDHGPRLRQLSALIAQQERGIDLMSREDEEAARRESTALQDSAAAAARIEALEHRIAGTRLTPRQLVDARSALSAATADLNNARRRAKESSEKRQSLTTRMAKASSLRDEARRESELLTSPQPALAPTAVTP